MFIMIAFAAVENPVGQVHVHHKSLALTDD